MLISWLAVAQMLNILFYTGTLLCLLCLPWYDTAWTYICGSESFTLQCHWVKSQINTAESESFLWYSAMREVITSDGRINNTPINQNKIHLANRSPGGLDQESRRDIRSHWWLLVHTCLKDKNQHLSCSPKLFEIVQDDWRRNRWKRTSGMK